MKSIFFAILIVPRIILAQDLNYLSEDSTITNKIENLKAIVETTFYDSAKFISGEIAQNNGNEKVHPYLNENLWKSGWVIMNNIKYPCPYIKYDIENDAIVILKTDTRISYPVLLHSKNISSFGIEQRVFLANDKNDGYFEYIPVGKFNLLINWTKRSSIHRTDGKIYVETHNYFLNINGQNHKINSAYQFYTCFPKLKKDLRKYKNNNNIKFTQDNLNGRIQMIEYANNLSGNEI